MRSMSRLLVLGGLAVLLVLPAGPASAHETRDVGPFEFVVGWYDEPAFGYQPNGPEVTITRRNRPVNEGVDLSVEIRFGEEARTLELEPAFVVGVFGEEGNYSADTFPTRPGTYEFQFTGTVAGQEIDETFTSGPETFSDVNDPSEFAFPVADPDNAQLAERLTQETERLTSALDVAEQEASSARTFGYIGIGVGVVAIIAALALGLRGRRPSG